MTLILGIETSCDETAAAIVEDGSTIRSNVIASQHDLHEEFGGVVPEIASRAHLERIEPVLTGCLQEADLAWKDVDAISVGNRPGLIGSLLVGVSAAQALAWSLGRPLFAINHVHAHLYAAAMQAEELQACYPALGLVVSGGHTSMYLVTSPTQMQRLGHTIDDAAGEAFDKAAVILGLAYPGGPNVDKAAAQGDPTQADLPRSLLGPDSLDFSFSGLKTALLYKVRGQPVGRGSDTTFERSEKDLNEQARCDLAASFQQAVVDALLIKLERALRYLIETGTSARCVLVGGGVSANSGLREGLARFSAAHDLPVYLPPMALCVDNAAMIAGLAYHLPNEDAVSDYAMSAIATAAE